MEIRALIPTETRIGWVCDVCGQNCQKHPNVPHSTELALFSASWGYWSDNKDMDRWDCDLCESCAEKVRDFIEKTLGGKVRVKEVGAK